jgi:hypothetical protein
MDPDILEWNTLINVSFSKMQSFLVHRLRFRSYDHSFVINTANSIPLFSGWIELAVLVLLTYSTTYVARFLVTNLNNKNWPASVFTSLLFEFQTANRIHHVNFYIYYYVSVVTCYFPERFLSNGCCIVPYFVRISLRNLLLENCFL